MVLGGGDAPYPWTILTSASRTAAALERRADDLLGARALRLTQLRILVDLEDRRTSYASQLARDLLLTRQSIHRHVAGLTARGVVSSGVRGGYVRTLALTDEGRDLVSHGLYELAPLLDRVASVADPSATAAALARLAIASQPPPPRWQL